MAILKGLISKINTSAGNLSELILNLGYAEVTFVRENQIKKILFAFPLTYS